MYCGSLCISSFSQTSNNLLQLENRSRSESSGCSNSRGRTSEAICLPSILSNGKMSSQNQIRKGTLGTIDHTHTLMEITNLIFSTSRDVGGTSNCTLERQLLANGSTWESSSNHLTRSSAVRHQDLLAK